MLHYDAKMRCWLLLPLAPLLVPPLLVPPLPLSHLLVLLLLSLKLLMCLKWVVVKHHTMPYSMCDIVQMQVCDGKDEYAVSRSDPRQ